MTGIAPHAFFLWFIACVLLILVSISSPTWESVSFLNAGTGPDRIRFGAFGYTGSNTTVGYDFPAAFVGYGNGKLTPGGNLHNMIPVLILHPIAAGLCFLGFLFGIVEAGCCYSEEAPGCGAFFYGLAYTCTLIVWFIDMVLWGLVRDVLRDNGVSAGYGNANWLTLGALIALSIDPTGCGFSACCISVSC